MATVTKIAPNRREGQSWEELEKLEERMSFILYEMAECDRIIREARKAEKRVSELRAELVALASKYLSSFREEGA